MPIYEYYCDNCKKKFEFLFFAGDIGVEICKFCGEKGIEKVISACSVVNKRNGDGYDVSSKNNLSSSCGGCSSSDCGGCK